MVAWLLSGCRPGNERWDPHKHRVLVTGWWRAGVIPLTTSNLKSGNSISGSGTDIYRRVCSATELQDACIIARGIQIWLFDYSETISLSKGTQIEY